MEELLKYKHKVQYYETDKMGIVHHSNYIRWFEEARSDFLEKAGFGYMQLEKAGIISPVLSVKCEYKHMTYYGEDVVIVSKIKSFNGVKLFVLYEVIGADDGVIRATGESSHCFLDKDGKPLRMKKTNPEFYEFLLQIAE